RLFYRLRSGCVAAIGRKIEVEIFPSMSQDLDLAGLRVLVVEDEMMVSMLIEDMLGDLGCQVVGPAARLDEAMALAADAEIDCAVLDVTLGGQPIFPLADLLR